MYPRSLAEDPTFHAEIFWLNVLAPRKISRMLDTLLTSHLEMSWLNA